MASFTYRHSNYCHNGPRQGVYPLQQLEHYRVVSWRACQLKHPESSYRNKCRTETAVLSGPPALPQRLTNIPTKMQSKEDSSTASTEDPSDQFMVTTVAMTIQPRPPQKDKPTPPVNKDPTHSTVGYPYPDPLKIKSDPLFEDRLATIAQHETNTAKQEEWNNRKKISSTSSSVKNLKPTSFKSSRSSIALSRPTSARGISATTSSVKLRKFSAPSQRPQSIGTKQPTIHSDNITTCSIHKSKSAIELKPAHNVANSENLPPDIPRTFLPENAGQETVIQSNTTSTVLCIESLSSDTDDSKGDNLNVTSDLGLSLDSLISGEESELSLDTKEYTEDVPRKSPVCFDVPNTPPRKLRRRKPRL